MQWRNRVLVLYFSLFCAFIFFSESIALAKQEVEISRHEIKLPNSENPLRFVVRSHTNEHGEKELSYEFEEIRQFLPETRTDVLFARDSRGTGRPDIWFYLDHKGLVHSIDQPSAEVDGWDIAENILLQQVNPKDRSFGGIVFHSLSTTLLFSADAHEKHIQKTKRLEMDLEELEIRADRIAKTNPNDRYSLYLKSQVRAGWADLAKKIRGNDQKAEILYGFADVAMFFAGGAILKGIGGAAKVGLKAGGEEATAIAERTYETVAASIEKSSEEAGARLGEGADRRLDEEVAARIAIHSLPESLDLSIRAMQTKEFLARAASKTLKGGASFLKAGLSQWKYIAVSQSLQVVAEIMERKDTVMSSNPITTVGKLFSDKDFDQDFAYMTVDGFFQAAASTVLPTLPKKLIVCGVISMVDSVSMNLIVKGETDPVRVGVDSGWEMGVGNAQTQLDLISLKAFEKMAVTTGHSKLALVGYAEVVVDQFAGYVGYADATKHIGWISDHAKAWADSLKSQPQNMQLQLMPIFAESPSAI